MYEFNGVMSSVPIDPTTGQPIEMSPVSTMGPFVALNPDPASDQIWSCSLTGKHEPERGRRITCIKGGFACFGLSEAACAVMVTNRAWRCVGLVLPDGRRMLVGETWVCGGHQFKFQHVVRLTAGGAAFECGGSGLPVRVGMPAEPERWHKLTWNDGKDVVDEVIYDLSSNGASRDAMTVGADGVERESDVTAEPRSSVEAIAAGALLADGRMASFARALDEAVAESTRECNRRPIGCLTPKQAIDALLIEDARLHPEFASARAAAVRAWVESCDHAHRVFPPLVPAAEPSGARIVLRHLHDHEATRDPREGGRGLYLAVYERERARSGVVAPTRRSR